jgi:hypothetical protein
VGAFPVWRPNSDELDVCVSILDSEVILNNTVTTKGQGPGARASVFTIGWAGPAVPHTALVPGTGSTCLHVSFAARRTHRHLLNLSSTFLD